MEKIINNNGLLTTEYRIKDKDKLEVRTYQDLGPILDTNKSRQADSDFNNGYTESRDMQHVASIPMIMLMIWAKEAGVDVYGREMNDIIRKKLNDPDYAYLRTGGGQIK